MEEEAALGALADGSEGFEEPAVCALANGSESTEEPLEPVVGVAVTEDEATPGALADGADGSESFEEAMVWPLADDSESIEEPVVCALANGNGGIEDPVVCASADGNGGIEEPVVCASADGNESINEPGVCFADGNESTEEPVVLLTIVSNDEKPTTSKEGAEQSSADEGNPRRRRQCNLKLSGQLFYGVVEASKRGIHPVIRYPIPDTDTCYAFEHVRSTKRGQLVVYRCTKCKKTGITTSIAVQNGCEFIGDPAELPHVCTPIKNAEDKVTRMVYQSCQAIAMDPTLGEAKPNQLWKSIAQFIDDNAPDDEAERKQMLRHFYKSGYKCRRRSIARAAAKAPRLQETDEKKPRKRPAPKQWAERMKRCRF